MGRTANSRARLTLLMPCPPLLVKSKYHALVNIELRGGPVEAERTVLRRQDFHVSQLGALEMSPEQFDCRMFFELTIGIDGVLINKALMIQSCFIRRERPLKNKGDLAVINRIGRVI